MSFYKKPKHRYCLHDSNEETDLSTATQLVVTEPHFESGSADRMGCTVEQGFSALLKVWSSDQCLDQMCLAPYVTGLRGGTLKATCWTNFVSVES